jgi:hypothetical protein
MCNVEDGRRLEHALIQKLYAPPIGGSRTSSYLDSRELAEQPATRTAGVVQFRHGASHPAEVSALEMDPLAG